MDYIELFKSVKVRTGMYLHSNNYYEAEAFILGCDAGNNWCLLYGFREWLIVRLQGSNNLAWQALALHAVFPNEPSPHKMLSTESQNQVAKNELFDLLVTFLTERNRPDGLRMIFKQYSNWLADQSWYEEDGEHEEA